LGAKTDQKDLGAKTDLLKKIWEQKPIKKI